jgi:polyisoprenoid-binding protein YceI
MTVAPLLASLVMLASARAATYTLDPGRTTPRFEIGYVALLTVNGRFKQTTGRITVDRDTGLGSVEATIQVNSLDTGLARRDEDLRSARFFDAARFPTMSFQSSRVSYVGKDAATVEGSFSLHGVTRPVILHVTRIHCAMDPPGDKEVCGFDSWTKIKRSDFGIKTYLPLISDEVKLSINGEAIEDDDAP